VYFLITYQLRVGFAIIAMCAFRVALAQTPDSLRVFAEDGWIEQLDQYIGLDVSLNNSYEIFEVKTPQNKLIIYPNTAANLRLNGNYKFLSVGFEWSPDVLPGNGDNESKGNTSSFELKTDFIFKHWFTHISYSKVRGYYLRNSSDFNEVSDLATYITFPDLNYRGYRLSIGYSTNSRFSFRSLTTQTERQLKSAGSFIPVVDVRYYIIDDRSNGTSTQKSNNFESTIGPGYAYTFVAKEKFYASLGLITAIGYLHTNLTTRQPNATFNTTQDNFIFRWDGRLGLGYNGDRFYTGLYTNIAGAQYRQENTSVMNFDTRIFYHLFFGVRLNAPKFMKRGADKLESYLK
jgi:hypothetical protein